MAKQYAAEQASSGTKKLLLSKLYTDAPVRTEPEEPQKIITAGLAEARPVKDYPDTFFGRALRVFRGEFKTLLKCMLFFLPFAAAFIVIFAWFADYFEKLTLDGIYNFMGGIGVGYPGGGDSLSESVGRLFWDVKEPVLLMLGATLIFGSLGLAGNFYCAKRSYFQDYYSKTAKTFWMGFVKYWWMFLIGYGSSSYRVRNGHVAYISAQTADAGHRRRGGILRRRVQLGVRRAAYAHTHGNDVAVYCL